MWTPPPLPTCRAERLALIIAGLCEVLAARAVKHRAAEAVLMLASTRLRRLSFRFATLVAKLREGRLSAARRPPRRAEPAPALAPAVEPPTGSGPAAGAEAPPATPRPSLPRGFGFLLRLAPGHEVPGCRAQVEHWLSDPEVLALLAQAPQAAGRILRPLCHMLGIELPPALRLPPREPPAPVVVPPASAPAEALPQPEASLGPGRSPGRPRPAPARSSGAAGADPLLARFKLA
jgi:hypothetical protein